jgi:hypothetical protein
MKISGQFKMKLWEIDLQVVAAKNYNGSGEIHTSLKNFATRLAVEENRDGGPRR